MPQLATVMEEETVAVEVGVPEEEDEAGLRAGLHAGLAIPALAPALLSHALHPAPDLVVSLAPPDDLQPPPPSLQFLLPPAPDHHSNKDLSLLADQLKINDS